MSGQSGIGLGAGLGLSLGASLGLGLKVRRSARRRGICNGSANDTFHGRHQLRCLVLEVALHAENGNVERCEVVERRHGIAACLDEVYDVTLVAIPPMPHFFISAVRRDADEGKHQQDGCPSNVGMDSANGIKKKFVVFENDRNDIQSHVLGSASLRDILQAEEDAAPLSVTEYDLSTETCAHYAQRISRSLDIAETNELAQFFISNIIENADVDKLKKMLPKAGKGGIRALAAIAKGGKGGVLRHFHKLVYSQLDIKV